MNSRRPLLLFISSMLVFGTIGIFRRYIGLSSAALALSRGMLGGAFLFLFTKKKAGKTGRKNFLLLCLSGALIGFNWMFLFEAYNYTGVAVATLCYYMQPTIVVLLSPLFFKERLTLKKILCAAAAVAGMVLVSGVAEGKGGADIRGVTFGLGAAVLYSSVVMLNKGIKGVEPFRKTQIQLFCAGLVMIPYLLLSGGFEVPELDAASVLLVLAVGIIHTGAAYVMYFGSIEALRVQTAAVLSYIDPVSAMVFSALILGERMSGAALCGAVMIIGSALLCEMPQRRKDGR